MVKNVSNQTGIRREDETYVALEHVESWTGQIRTSQDGVDFSSFVKRFKPEDVLFGKLRPYLAKVARPSYRGVCAGEFFVLRSASGADHTPPFLEQLLRSAPFIEFVNSSTFGAKMPRADWHFVGNAEVACPPPEEQEHIVHFLNHADRLVNRLIRAKLRLIELLNEQKQATIHRAVTRGLDPDVPMKPTGLDWLPEVPEHWEVKRLKYCVRFVSGGTPDTNEPDFWNGATPWVSPKDMKTLDIYETEDHVTEKAIREGKTPLVPENSVLMVVRSGILRKHIPVAVACQAVTVNQDLKGIIVNEQKLSPCFLAAQIAGSQDALLAVWRKLGATVESLEHDFVANTLFPVPPLSEQEDILSTIRSESRYIDQAIERTRREIELIREYRTRLISDVVTGKLDVRGVKLPEVEEAEVSLDGLDPDEAEELPGAGEVAVSGPDPASGAFQSTR
ncbi:MAG: restriction endonuclease subunit S [Rubrobacter sp.]|nr:restriction endonuclease subunit S [Rubrobacter sp.]